MGELLSIAPEPLVRAEAVAEYLGVKPMTVWRWSHFKEDPLPAIKVGLRNYQRYRMSEVEAWLERRKTA